MPTDDEFRRVAEDVRALARSLTRDIRAAVDRNRVEGHDHRAPGDGVAAAGRAARQELRRAQLAVRQSGRARRHDRPGQPRGGGEHPTPGSPPRCDNWGGSRWHGGQRPVSTSTTGASSPSAGNPADPGNPAGPGNPDDARYGNDAPYGAGYRPDAGGWNPGLAVRRLPDRRARRRMAAAAAPPLRHRHDGSTVFGLLIVVFGLAWLAAGTNLARFSAESVFAVALMILGVASVVTARTDWAMSRRSWPLAVGAGLVLALIVSAASPTLPVGFQHLRFGSQNLAPTSWPAVPPIVHAGVGRTVVDLRGISGALPAPKTVAIDSAAGGVVINLPPDVQVIVSARVAAGQITVNEFTTGGVQRIDNQTLNPNASGSPLILNVDSGFGSVEITQAVPGLDRPAAPVPPTDPGSP